MQLVFFRLHLVLHACAAKFDVMDTAQIFLNLNRPLVGHVCPRILPSMMVGAQRLYRSWEAHQPSAAV